MSIPPALPERPEELPENNPPMRLTHLEPIKVLHGGMSMVYICNVLDHGWDYPQVAVKVLKPVVNAFPGASERFLRECYLWLQLGEHSNVVSALSAHHSTGEAAILVLEYVPHSLRQVLERGSMPLDSAVRTITEIVNGLAYANDILPGFVHGDLKPENVLATSEGTAKITDLGLSRVAEESEKARGGGVSRSKRDGSGGGTPLYMAPEMIRGQRIGSAADIYAIGCIAYEVMTGSPAYGRPTSVPDYLMRHLHSAPVPIDTVRPGIPAFFRELTIQCLAKSPASRPSLSELRDQLRQLAVGLGTVVPDAIVMPAKIHKRVTAAQGLMNLGLIEEARRAAELALDETADDVSATVLRLIIARSYGEEEKYALAEPYLNSAEKVMENDNHKEYRAIYLNERGRAARASGQLRQALDYILESIQALPEASAGYANAAAVLWELGEADEAIDMISRALAISANFIYFRMLVSFLSKEGRSEETLSLCDHIVAIHPTVGEAYVLRSYARIAVFMKLSRLDRNYIRLQADLASDLGNAMQFGGDPEVVHQLQVLVNSLPTS